MKTGSERMVSLEFASDDSLTMWKRNTEDNLGIFKVRIFSTHLSFTSELSFALLAVVPQSVFLVSATGLRTGLANGNAA